MKSSGASDAAISISGLTKHYGKLTAVNGLNLEVQPGQIFGFLGLNGAGKTTTIRMLVGQLPPDSGRASILGHDCWHGAAALRRRIGYVPERPRLYDWMTVAEIGWFVAGFHQAGFLDLYRQRVEAFGLELSQRLKQLSKGEYAKVSLALALAPDPEVLILDEPTSGLDPALDRQVMTMLRQLADAGRVVLVVTHSLTYLDVCDQVLLLAPGGKTAFYGPPSQIGHCTTARSTHGSTSSQVSCEHSRTT